MTDVNLDGLCEQIHALVNPKKLDRDQLLTVYAMLVADAVASIQCAECRQAAVGLLMQRLLPHYLGQAMKAPISGHSDHLH